MLLRSDIIILWQLKTSKKIEPNKTKTLKSVRIKKFQSLFDVMSGRQKKKVIIPHRLSREQLFPAQKRPAIESVEAFP